MKLSSFCLKALTAAILLTSTTGLAIASHCKNYKGDNFVTAPCAQNGLQDGFYLGGQVGYDSYRVRQNFNLGNANAISGNPAINVTGFVGGLFLGYGKYFNNLYYLGGELFGDYSSASNNSSVSVTEVGTVSSKITARGAYGISILPGIKLTNDTMGYLRLGYNWSRLKSQENVLGNGVNKSNTSHGFNYGLGLETLLCGNWSARLEYSHTDYSSFTAPTTGTQFSPSNNQVMLGVLYHFA